MGLGRVLWAGALASSAVAIGLGAIKGEEGPAVDRELFELVNRGAGPAADRALVGITELGSFYASGAAAGALFALGRRRAAFSALGAAGTTWLLLQGAKRIASRPRPADVDPHDVRLLIARPAAASWPSSHPAVLTAFTRVASRELLLGSLARVGLGCLDATVGISRVYVGVHYPSDVASGLLLGRAVARLWPRAGSA